MSKLVVCLILTMFMLKPYLKAILIEIERGRGGRIILALGGI